MINSQTQIHELKNTLCWLLPQSRQDWMLVALSVSAVAVTAFYLGALAAFVVGAASLAGYSIYRINQREASPKSLQNQQQIIQPKEPIRSEPSSPSVSDAPIARTVQSSPLPDTVDLSGDVAKPLEFDEKDQSQFDRRPPIQVNLDRLGRLNLAVDSLKPGNYLDASLIKMVVDEFRLCNPNLAAQFNYIQSPNAPLKSLIEDACKLGRDKPCYIITNTGSHYILIKLDWDAKAFRVYDSLYNFNEKELAQEVDLAITQIQENTGTRLNFEKPLPEAYQKDRHSCGVFVICFLQKLVWNPHFAIFAKDDAMIRKTRENLFVETWRKFNTLKKDIEQDPDFKEFETYYNEIRQEIEDSLKSAAPR